MDAQEFQKAQKAKLLACYGETPESLIAKSQENDIEKGGEGSKGGKIIGHTRTGKPIYDHETGIKPLLDHFHSKGWEVKNYKKHGSKHSFDVAHRTGKDDAGETSGHHFTGGASVDKREAEAKGKLPTHDVRISGGVLGHTDFYEVRDKKKED